jgi:hypothetical protein
VAEVLELQRLLSVEWHALLRRARSCGGHSTMGRETHRRPVPRQGRSREPAGWPPSLRVKYLSVNKRPELQAQKVKLMGFAPHAVKASQRLPLARVPRSEPP